MQRFYTAAVTIPSYLDDRTVTSLILTASLPVLVLPIVGTYLNATTHSALTKLQVEFDSLHSVACIPPPEQTDQRQLRENLLRINILKLSGVTMGWSSIQFSGLVELQLRSMHPCPSMDQIYDMLNASPNLCTVELEWLRPESSVLTGFRSNTRIKLPKLSFLHLGGSICDFIDRLLQVIEPGIGQLCLKLSNIEAWSKEFESFRIQHKVTTLSLRIPSLPLSMLDQILSEQELVTTLVLAGQDISDFNMVLDTIGSLCTSMRRVVLRRCCISFEGIRRIASIHSVHSLWMENCTYTLQTSLDASLELPEDELKWLEENISDLHVDYAHRERTPDSLPWWLR